MTVRGAAGILSVAVWKNGKWITVDVEMLYESTAVLDIQQECLLFKPFFDWLFCYLHSKVS